MTYFETFGGQLLNDPAPEATLNRLVVLISPARCRVVSLRGGGDEEALQSRRQTDQRMTSQDAGAETPRAKDGSTFQFVPY